MNKKILLPVSLAVMTVTAADAASKTIVSEFLRTFVSDGLLFFR